MPMLRMLFLRYGDSFDCPTFAPEHIGQKISEPSRLPWNLPLLVSACAILMCWQSWGLTVVRQDMTTISLNGPTQVHLLMWVGSYSWYQKQF